MTDDRPRFFAKPDRRGRVHVGRSYEPGVVPYTTRVTMHCGHTELRNEWSGMAEIDTFADDDLCHRCWDNWPGNSADLFGHPTP